ncbi:chromosome transmission fidelity protein 18 [Phyllosticta citrichinensis]|uniref:Chromosome transmission fidelity protein 18 n=1 Tax=Phyllosticta citrichinensis TaxID=1130410 RepID=A0ABR1XL20_9PEZI
MSFSDLDDLPTSFDPALHLHSEDPAPVDDPALPTSSCSDEFEALALQTKETIAAKTEQGIVIQHRAWKLPEVFRSEEDHLLETPIKRQRILQDHSIGIAGSSSPPYAPPSSPPSLQMPLESSPVQYPRSSSPVVDTPRKRRRVDGEGGPLHDLSANKENKKRGPFLDEDSDDEEDYATIKAAHGKRKATVYSVPPIAVASDFATEFPTVQDGGPIDADDGYLDVDVPLEEAASQPTLSQATSKTPITIKTCSGKSMYIAERRKAAAVPFEQLIAQRSSAKEGSARKSYYGIDIHALMDEAAQQTEQDSLRREHMDTDAPRQSIEASPKGKKNRHLMWTEKYRARKFTDLVGDERTHRSVLKWLKAWDPIVFPGSSRPKPRAAKAHDNVEDEPTHRKIMLLTGPPGLGKTTLAHVCARQAGYEVQEINASDERSRDVVRNRIKDMVGTENVRGINTKTSSGETVRKAGKPVCVVVDEVDGVVSGSGGGSEGGFIKALIDLVHLDQKNSAPKTVESTTKKRKKGDKFRLLRPMILICNDLYHPSLRTLRQSSIAEIIHIRKPPINMVVPRLHAIFEREGVPADTDGVRRLCEATWGVSSRKEGGSNSTGEGDVRGVMVVGEWVARKLLAETSGSKRLTRKWIEENIINDLSHGGGAARGLGRGGAKEVVERVFKDGAGFPKSAALVHAQAASIENSGSAIGVAESTKRYAMSRLREMVDTAGETDRIVTECFTTFPDQPFQDDGLLSKPTNAYTWLHFHDAISSALYSGQEWELTPYLSSPVLAFHSLFASSIRPSMAAVTALNRDKDGSDASEPLPFTGPSAPYQVSELTRANQAALAAVQSNLSINLSRMYRSSADISTELIPYLLRMLSPDVKPVIINTASAADKSKSAPTASVRKASEKELVRRAVNAMSATGVRFEKSRVDFVEPRQGNGGWVYRMEPPLDAFARFETMTVTRATSNEKVRYGVRQILDAELKREAARLEFEARKRWGGVVDDVADDVERMGVEDAAAAAQAVAKKIVVKKDFFGRVVVKEVPVVPAGEEGEAELKRRRKKEEGKEAGRVWVSYHEGFSNAVRKPITLAELLGGL